MDKSISNVNLVVKASRDITPFLYYCKVATEDFQLLDTAVSTRETEYSYVITPTNGDSATLTSLIHKLQKYSIDNNIKIYGYWFESEDNTQRYSHIETSVDISDILNKYLWFDLNFQYYKVLLENGKYKFSLHSNNPNDRLKGILNMVKGYCTDNKIEITYY